MIAKILSLIIGIGGVLVAAYVGIVVMFVGGIAEIVDALQVTPVNGSTIAWAVVKIIFSDTIAVLVGIFFVSVALFLWSVGDDQPSRRHAGGSARQVERNWERIQRGGV